MFDRHLRHIADQRYRYPRYGHDKLNEPIGAENLSDVVCYPRVPAPAAAPERVHGGAGGDNRRLDGAHDDGDSDGQRGDATRGAGV